MNKKRKRLDLSDIPKRPNWAELSTDVSVYAPRPLEEDIWLEGQYQALIRRENALRELLEAKEREGIEEMLSECVGALEVLNETLSAPKVFLLAPGETLNSIASLTHGGYTWFESLLDLLGLQREGGIKVEKTDDSVLIKRGEDVKQFFSPAFNIDDLEQRYSRINRLWALVLPSGVPDETIYTLDEALWCFEVGAYRGAAVLARTVLEAVLYQALKAGGAIPKEPNVTPFGFDQRRRLHTMIEKAAKTGILPPSLSRRASRRKKFCNSIVHIIHATESNRQRNRDEIAESTTRVIHDVSEVVRYLFRNKRMKHRRLKRE